MAHNQWKPPERVADADPGVLGAGEFFELTNLSPKRTGVPIVAWISSRGGAPHDVRVKVSSGPKAHPDEFVSVALRPAVRVVEGSMTAHDFALLRAWIGLNRDVLIRYREGEIEYTEDAIAALRPVR